MRVSEYKRSLLYRKAQANVCKKHYFNKIQSVINSPVEESNFLNLEDTDGIINSLKDKGVISKNKIEIDNYKLLVEFIKKKVAGLSYYLLIDEEWRFCGAYKTNDNISNNYNFDELHSDEIRIISCDLSFQIQIDYDYYEIECEYILYK